MIVKYGEIIHGLNHAMRTQCRPLIPFGGYTSQTLRMLLRYICANIVTETKCCRLNQLPKKLDIQIFGLTNVSRNMKS